MVLVLVSSRTVLVENKCVGGKISLCTKLHIKFPHLHESKNKRAEVGNIVTDSQKHLDFHPNCKNRFVHPFIHTFASFYRIIGTMHLLNKYKSIYVF